MISDHLLEVLGRFGAVIEGHLWEEVMDDMEVGDIVKEETALPSEEVAVDGSGGATLEVPFLATVVGMTGSVWWR